MTLSSRQRGIKGQMSKVTGPATFDIPTFDFSLLIFSYLCIVNRNKKTIIIMKSILLFILFWVTMILSPVMAQEQQVVPYTLADRDRAIRTEAKMEALETKMDAKFEAVNVRFESQQKQLDDIKSLFYWGFGILITLFIFMLGYMIWDRRTALKPALDQASSANEKVRNLLTALREYAKTHPDLAEILKSYGVL